MDKIKEEVKTRRERSKWKGSKDQYNPDIHGKIIPSFPDYSADTQGNIWSFKDKIPKKIVQMTKNRNYPKCTLLNDQGRFCKSTHTLVAEAFLGPMPDDPNIEIRHLDSNKLNYKPENLAYGTKSQNRIDSILLNVNTKLTLSQAREVYNLAIEGKLKHEEIAEMFDISAVTVSGIKNKRCWSWMHDYNE